MSSGEIKHEDTFVKTSPIWLGELIICLIIIGSFIFTYFYFLGTISNELNDKQRNVISYDAEELKKYEQDTLHGLSLDKSGKSMQIPIDYAMDLVIENYKK